MVVHHGQLKYSHFPFQASEPVCPSREVGEFHVVVWLMLHLHNSVLTVFHVLDLPDLDSVLICQTDTDMIKSMFAGREHIGGG